MALGDQIISLSRGKHEASLELQSLFSPDIPRNKGIPIVPRLSYQPKPSPFEGIYWTFQFDKSYGQRTWAPENQWEIRQIHALYHEYRKKINLIDVGHRKFNLKTVADIMHGAQGHLGVCSGMGWFALACGLKPHIYYTANHKANTMKSWKRWWAANGAKVLYFNEEFTEAPCSVALDGKKYTLNDSSR